MAHSLTSQTACPIKTIPVEILLTTTQYLETPDLCSLRLSCKVIEDRIWNSFTEEFFSRKQFMLSPFSLRALVSISQHGRLADKIRCLQIGTDQIVPLHLDRADTESFSLDSYLQANNAFAAQSMLLSTGKQVKLLAQAMRNLPNLEKVIVRDFNSTSRKRDRFYTWRSYGAKTTEMHGPNICMGSLTSLPSTGNFIGVVFNSVLSALGEADVSVKSLEHLSKGETMYDESFAIDLDISPEILPVLRGLQRFHVSLTLRRTTAELWPILDSTQSDVTCTHDNWHHYRHFMAFLQHMPDLRDLRINAHNGGAPEASSLLNWLSLPISAKFTGLPSPVNLEKLEALSLGFIAADPGILLAVIAKFAPRLRKLELWKVSLPRPPAPSSGTHPKPSAWEPFIKRLVAIPQLHLEEIMIGCMQERDVLSRLSRRPVRFTDRQATKHYKGTDWKTFVEKNIIPLIGPSEFPNHGGHPDVVSDNNSSDSDESMDDEDAQEDSEEEEDDE